MEGFLLPIGLLLLGIVALFVEAFVPSAGMITVIGLCSVVGAVVLAFNLGNQAGVIFLGLSIVLVPASLILAFSLLPKSRWGKRLSLQTTQTPESGYVAQDLREQQLIGKSGVATSMLRPSGTATIDGRRYDVITEGEMIESGTAIEVRSVEGNRIVVRAIRSSQ